MSSKTDVVKDEPIDVKDILTDELLNGEIVSDEPALKSFSTTATLLDFNRTTGRYTVLSAMASPTCRGTDFIDACRTLAQSITYRDRVIGNETRYVQFTLQSYDVISDMVENDDGSREPVIESHEIRLHVMIKRSGSQCATCGNIKSDFDKDDHTYWCNDSTGCGKWRTDDSAPRSRRTIDVDAAAAVF